MQFVKGALVVHGLTGTPANMAPITEALKARGYVVGAPLLAGHGKNLQTLAASHWQDWYGSVVKAFDELSHQAKEVYYVGISMGALLGLKLAQDCRNAPKGLALLAVPFRLRPLFRNLVIPGVRYTPLRFLIHSTAKNFEKSVLDPEGREFYREHSLHRMPAPAVFQTENLVKEIKKNLSEITQPLLMIHGHRDHLADPHGMLEIQKRVSSKQVEMVMMENSAHVLSLDYDKEIVARKVCNFFDSCASAVHTR